ncbi:MAG: hypothetical protein AAFP00_12200, partial [Bacteroidota bacterium]
FLGYIHEFFRRKPGTQALEIPFSYPKIPLAITYETHLKNLVQHLRDINYPHAFYSELGSFAIRCDAYQAQNGISKQAQDPAFDLMHKFAKIGRIKTFEFARVVLPWRRTLNPKKWEVLNPERLSELENIFSQLDRLFKEERWEISETMERFLAHEQFEGALKEMYKHGKSLDTFKQRFFSWWHPNRTRKYLEIP